MTVTTPKNSTVITDWDAFKVHLNNLPTKKEVGDGYEGLVKHFLLNDPVYTTKLKEVWLLKEVPSKTRLHLGLPDTDQGIDIIALTYDDEYWAIQCKYKGDETKSITWSELSTFTGLAFGICKNISFGLICTTGEKYSKIFKGQEKISFCTNEVWRNLSSSFFKEMQTNKTFPKKPLAPYAHQKKAIRLANDHYIKGANRRGKLIMPCGTGKSLTSYWIGENLQAKTILVAVPSLSLLRQTIRVWISELVAANKVSDFEWLCVCSDNSVTDMEADDLSTLTRDMGVPCVTDLKQISDWLQKTNGRQIRIIFTTYQSGKILAAASQAAKVTYDFGVFDEAHKTTGKANSLFSWLLYDKNIDISKRLFMTATERYYKGASDQVVSMEDGLIYGNTFMDMTFKEAQRQKPQIICDYKILTLYITRKEIKDLINNNEFVHPAGIKWEEDVTANMLASLVALKKVMQQYPVRHAVSYHSSIAKAKAFQESADVFSRLFPEYGSLDTYHIKGSDPTSLRDRLLTDFSRSDRSLVTNSKCLIEGIDVPEIDCVLFADPKRSTTDIVQALGRALRPAKNKEYGYIVIPVIIDDPSDIEGLFDTSSFSDMFAILRALAANDERVIDYFRSFTHDNSPGNSLIDDMHSLVGLSRVVDVDEFIGAVNLYCWDSLVKLAYWPYERASRYVKKLGLVNEDEWYFYRKHKLMGLSEKPESIPDKPQEIYGEQWKGWKDWLGVKNDRSFSRYFTFTASKQFARTLGLVNEKDWANYVGGKFKTLPKKPYQVPVNPEFIYKNEWKGWKDWLDGKTYLPFEQAKKFVNKLGLASISDWNEYCLGNKPDLPKLPHNIPFKPDTVYVGEWLDWKDWLGVYLPFEQARAFVHQLHFWSTGKWKKYAKGQLPDIEKLPVYIPGSPDRVYAEQWVSWSDWLRGSPYLTFKEARSFVHKLGFKGKYQWDLYISGHYSLPAVFIPKRPDLMYSEEWIDWNNWIGWDDLKRGVKYPKFDVARTFARSLGLKSTAEWQRYCNGEYPSLPKKPENIPIRPKTVYYKKWKGIQDWLTDDNDEPIPFNIARAYVKSAGIKNMQEWDDYAAGKIRKNKPLPNGIPRHPDSTYLEEWISWADWLGLNG